MSERATTRRRTRAAALLAAAAVVSAPWVTGAAPAQAGPPGDAVLDWNRHALDVLVTNRSGDTSFTGAGQAPTVAVQHLAMVQLAVYDAVNAVDGGHQPYLGVDLEEDELPVPLSEASLSAAVTAAAHDVLAGVRTLPALSSGARARLTALRRDALDQAEAQDGPDAVEAGTAVGEAAAAAVLHAREDDGRYGTFRFAEGTGVGEWRPTSGINDPAGWVARVDPFTLESSSQFRTKGPHALDSGSYAKEYEEVRQYGRFDSSVRTQEQTALALFHTAHPPEMYNALFRDVSAAQGLSLVEQARLFAMLNTAGADALINCWDDKAFWGFWRPVTAIHDGEDDDNPRTPGEPGWTSLVPAPPYPDHPSGYSCVTGAFMYTAQTYFGAGPLPFVLRRPGSTSHEPRPYQYFRDAVDDVVEARMLLGIHFRSPNEQGAALGRDVAQWVARNFFQPVRDEG